ncbi:MAG: hypothetical protein ACPGVY_11165 [Mycobacterium sp.]
MTHSTSDLPPLGDVLASADPWAAAWIRALVSGSEPLCRQLISGPDDAGNEYRCVRALGHEFVDDAGHDHGY